MRAGQQTCLTLRLRLGRCVCVFVTGRRGGDGLGTSLNSPGEWTGMCVYSE